MNNSIAVKKPELIAEWSEKNFPLSPECVSFGSNKLYWWKGACGHEWQASAKARSSGERCPICSSVRIIPGVNDLKSQCPELMEEWSSKNIFSPDTVGVGSHKKAIWIGRCGHEWNTEIRYRVNGVGCPYCSHNKVLTGLNDLATLYPKVAKEWSRRNYPLKATDVTAYSNKKVWWKCQKGHEWESRIADRSYGSKCPYCSGKKLLRGFNDLATKYPHLAYEWSERNGELRVDAVNDKSTKNIWWHCSVCGYEYKAVIKSRVNGLMCPVCAERAVMSGYNDLSTTDPKLISEWDYQKNGPILPTKISRYSAKNVWWKGSCGHLWRDKICNRAIDRRGCARCNKEFNDIFNQMLISHYAKLQGLKVIFQDEQIIGIPVDAYIPDLGLVFLFLNRRAVYMKKVQNIIKFLCNKRGLICVEVSKCDLEEICVEIKQGFSKTHKYIVSDNKKDIELLRKNFLINKSIG